MLYRTKLVNRAGINDEIYKLSIFSQHNLHELSGFFNGTATTG